MRVSLRSALSAGAIAALFAFSAAADSIRIGPISEITGPNAEARIFATAYRAKFNLEPDVYSSRGDDALNVIAAAMNAAKSSKPDDFRKAILGLKNGKGVEGNYTFDENGDGLRGYNIVKNEGGKIKFVEHINVDK